MSDQLALPVEEQKGQAAGDPVTLKRLLITCMVAAGALSVAVAVHWSGTGGDFLQDYSAASRLRSGESIYAGWNHHPPLASVLIVPLSFLGPQAAFVAFNVFSLCLYGYVLDRTLRTLQLTEEQRLVGMTLVLAWPLQLGGIALGTWSLLVSTALLTVWLLERSGYDRSAGAILGLATSVKLYPAFILLYFVFRRKWQATTMFLLGVIGLVGLCVPLVGGDAFLTYFQDVLFANVRRYLAFPHNISLQGAIERLFRTAGGWSQAAVSPPTWLARPVAIGGQAVLIAIFVRLLLVLERDTPQTDPDLLFALCLVTMLLALPLSWGHYATVLPLCFAVLYADGRGLGRLPVACLLAVFSLPLLVFQLITGVPLSAVPLRVRSINAIVVTCGLLGLFAVIAHRLQGPEVAAHSRSPTGPRPAPPPRTSRCRPGPRSTRGARRCPR